MLKLFRRRKTVASLTGSLTKMVDDLKAHAIAEHDRALELVAEAGRIRLAAQAASDEALKADVIASKINRLVT